MYSSELSVLRTRSPQKRKKRTTADKSSCARLKQTCLLGRVVFCPRQKREAKKSDVEGKVVEAAEVEESEAVKEANVDAVKASLA